MKTIGLVGGMSWESSAEYYRQLNEGVKARLGGLHSARLVLHSVDFGPIEAMQREGRWDEAGDVLHAAVRGLEAAGADFVVLCANTMHKVADRMMAGARIPLLHIADPTGEAARAAGIGAVGLLGTRYTMEEDFYRARLEARHGLEVLVPGPEDRAEVNRIIFEELVLGIVSPASRARFLEVADRLARAGAEGIVSGCTEFGLLVPPDEGPLPIFDTARLHVKAALELALAP
ncbi:MAG TPA: aspartate/glutamate racemase family protein [Anaeromyxobacteraceae bacterium]|nr:aspartate/glutamate racemase family protein [Anaeromyxobacteraceae bacterium]